jgi:hypothetical protein
MLRINSPCGRACGVTAQALQAAALMRFANGGSVQGKARPAGQQRIIRCLFHWRYAAQGEGLASGMR